MNAFETPLSERIWDTKYRHRRGEQVLDADLSDTWARVAGALAAPEGGQAGQWAARFFSILEGFRFLPGGRILAGAGTGLEVTLFNCFVMGLIEDSMEGIFEALKQGALTMQQGGGVGYDFSTLRPAGSGARHAATIASGPVSFMEVWDSMCATVLSTGARRGAMMATLRCDHPDIERFIEAKQVPGRLRRFNLSVQVSDAFLAAVDGDEEWPLVFPAEHVGGEGETVLREWPGYAAPVPCRVVRKVPARALWDRIMVATYDYAEPGVLFVDSINRANNLHYRERISATNPCGEIPLPPWGACLLGAVNLTRFVDAPFTPRATVDFGALSATVATAVRLLDNAVEVSRFPLAEQAAQARGSRRLGLGLTGLADTLVMLGLRYDSETGRDCAADLMRRICHTAYGTSVELAREKGPFPFFERDAYLSGPFIQSLPQALLDAIARHGIRNSHLTAIAPTGTISLLAGNVSSGLEPIFELEYSRHLVERDGSLSAHGVQDAAYRLWRQLYGAAALPETFVRAHQVAPADHLAMQAALQPWVDNAVSKTINIPADYPFESFRELYRQAHRLGLKGCTTFRPNPITGAVLTPLAAPEPAAACCGLEREAD